MQNIDMLKAKTLILTQTDPEVDVMFNNWLANGLNAGVIFKKVSKPLRAIRRKVANNMPAKMLKPWLNDWKYELNKYETVIIHASELTRHLPAYIHYVNPQLRIIYWYWNPVNSLSLPSLVNDSNVEFWTFDQNDQKKYGMQSNIQYYSGNDNSVSTEAESLYDVYFIGHDKGRKKKITQIVKQIEKLGFYCRIDLLSDNSKSYIPYEKVKRRTQIARSILEINQEGQIGYTLRALEALFLEKKLITTNKNIINEKFYSPQNIFVIGIDEWKKLPSVIKTPYDQSVNKYKAEYNIDAWFNNFFR